MHRIYQQTDLDELNNSIQIDFNHNPNIQQAFYQFQSEIFQFIYLYQSQTNQQIQSKQQQLNKIIIKLNSIKAHNHNYQTSQNKSQDGQQKLIQQKYTNQILNQNQSLEEEFKELKKHHQQIINNFEQEKLIVYQQEQQLKKEFQVKIQKLEQELIILLDENQKKEQIISELNDLNQSKVLQIQQQEVIQQLTAKLQEGVNNQISLNDQLALLKENSNSLLNDFEKSQFDKQTLQKEKQYFQIQFEKQQNENIDLLKHQQKLNENQQIQIEKLKQDWQYQNNKLQEQLGIKDQKLSILQNNYNTLQNYKQELENLLKQSRNENNKLKDQIDQLQQFQTKINKQNYTIQNLIEQNQQYENILNNNASEKKLFELKIVELQRKIQQIQLHQYPQERDSLNQKINKLQKENEDKQSEIKILQADNFELKKQIKQEQVNQVQIKALITNLQNDRSQYQQQKTQIEQQLEKQYGQKINKQILNQKNINNSSIKAKLRVTQIIRRKQQTNEWQNQQKMLNKKQVQSEQHLESAFNENETLRVRISELEYKLEEEIDRNQQLIEETKKYSIDSKQKDVYISECKSKIQIQIQQLNNIERDKQEQRVNQLNDSQQSAYIQEIEQFQFKIKQYQNELKENENQQQQLNQKLQEALKKLELIQLQLQEEQLKSHNFMKQLQSISENKSSIQPSQDIMDLFDVQTSSRIQQIETILLPETNQLDEQISILSQQLQLLQQQLKEQNESLEKKDKLINDIMQQKSQIQSSLDNAIVNINNLESQVFCLKKEQQSLDQLTNDINHYQQKISNQYKLIESLQNQLEELQIELQEYESKVKIQGVRQQSSEEQVAFKELISQRDQEILNLQEELKNLHQHVEQRMNKSVISNHSKRSQNIIKFEQFADIDENDIDGQSYDEDEILIEKQQLKKVLDENEEKIKRLEIQLQNTQEYTKKKINQELGSLKTQLNSQIKVIEELNTQIYNQSNELEQKEKEIHDLREELNKYDQQKEHIMNKSMHSNRSKRSQNQINLNQFVDIQAENSLGSNEQEVITQQLEEKNVSADMQKQVQLQNNQMNQELQNEKKILNEIAEINQPKNECLKEESQNNKDCFN